MGRRFRNPRCSSGGIGSCGIWINDFVNKVTTPFVPCKFEQQEPTSERFSWMARTIDSAEFGAALDMCKNSSPGEDGIKFTMIKNLPPEAKQFLLEIFNVILATGIVPEPWKRTKVIPILKPGKDAGSADSYRPTDAATRRKQRTNYRGRGFQSNAAYPLLSPTTGLNAVAACYQRVSLQ
jgi:hypothetical protein